ncbi:MAG: hypothetical protein LBI82_13640 [Dysgonamonadaceae bacterium]|jgi:hypothetical protein|nr:hypothetical protein [Dysgonamonadaceae bacterium]
MENLGEHLVGQYLRAVKNCDFVEYNLQTKFVQGEIDVVGINSAKKQIYICEVATHLETGLQYVKNRRPNNVERFQSKFTKNIEYAKRNFQEYECHYMLWSPIIRIPKKEDTKNNQEQDLREIKVFLKEKFDVELELVYNQKYLNCIAELRKVARETTQEMSSPIMRFLQIEEKLKIHCKKISI